MCIIYTTSVIFKFVLNNSYYLPKFLYTVLLFKYMDTCFVIVMFLYFLI